MSGIISHLEKQWTSIGNYNQRVWEHIYDDYFHGDERALVVIGSVILINVALVLFASWYTLVDLLDWPSWFVKLRIQTERTFTMQKFWKCLLLSTFNGFIVSYIQIECYYHVSKWWGPNFGRTLPTAGQMVRDLIIAAISDELFFYYIHRALHHRSIYKYIHKVHHEWKAPIALVTFYTHPVEHFLATGVAVVAAPIFFKMHIATVWVFVTIGVLATVIIHCGYFNLIPGPFDPETHEAHHITFNYNYGNMRFMDWLHGTGVDLHKKENANRKWLEDGEEDEKKESCKSQ